MSPRRGLDAFNALVASVQTGFGPFVAVYLASEAWTQREIGQALSLGTIAAMLSQVPGGAAVDAMRSKRLAALISCLAVAASAILLAILPTRGPVLVAEILHGFASCMLSPAIAAVSLRLVGRDALGERLGRNARYAAIGSGVAAAVMGAVGSAVSEAAVFWLTALLMAPALAALATVRLPAAEPRAPSAPPDPAPDRSGWSLLYDPRVLGFAACMLLFQLGNAAALPLVGAQLTRVSGSEASLVIAACIIVPQVLVALISPLVGRLADRWGRRRVLVVALAVVPLRIALLASAPSPVMVVAIQALDGFSAAGIGVLLPLVAADLTRGTNRFNLCMGAFGLAVGLGATVSTWAAGIVADRASVTVALLCLAAASAAAAGLAAILPEPSQRIRLATRPA